MNDSRDFQDAESVRSGHSHVTSQPVSFPPHPIPGGMLSRSFGMPSRREGPPSIWDTHGISGNVFADPVASSTAPYPQELSPWSSGISEPIHSSTAEKNENQTPVKIRDASLHRGQGDGVPKAGGQQAAADSQGSRTCVCASTLWTGGWHTQVEKDEFSSCRGTVKSAWQKPPVRRKGGRAGLPARVSGRHVVRGTDRPHTYPGSAPRGTGKAGENGQNSGEVGGSSAWTRPSAPECGDTLKALAGDQRPT